MWQELWRPCVINFMFFPLYLHFLIWKMGILIVGSVCLWPLSIENFSNESSWTFLLNTHHNARIKKVLPGLGPILPAASSIFPTAHHKLARLRWRDYRYQSIPLLKNLKTVNSFSNLKQISTSTSTILSRALSIFMLIEPMTREPLIKGLGQKPVS